MGLARCTRAGSRSRCAPVLPVGNHILATSTVCTPHSAQSSSPFDCLVTGNLWRRVSRRGVGTIVRCALTPVFVGLSYKAFAASGRLRRARAAMASDKSVTIQACNALDRVESRLRNASGTGHNSDEKILPCQPQIAHKRTVDCETATKASATLAPTGGLTEFDSEEENLPPLPATPKNCISELDQGPSAVPGALENEAFYFPSLNGPSADREVFERLMDELNFRTCWLNTGMKFSRDICLGNDDVVMRSPTYHSIVMRIARFFGGVKVVRTLANLYRDGEDWCNLHSDQYHQGGYPIDLTVGASFGDPRRLILVEKRDDRHRIEIPQRNGDVFAFSDQVNANWRHMVPREPAPCGPRISIIVWCTRQTSKGNGEVQDGPGFALGEFPHMLYDNPKGAGRDYVAGRDYGARPIRGGGWDRRGKGRRGGWKGKGHASSAVDGMISKPK
mmetsp:Transcript_70225/g.139057  ORF Transcript_70225/g.139057 Transcript_70225/m.139057 type:complete len:447 (+) Transcript_70225:43-1383(+)